MGVHTAAPLPDFTAESRVSSSGAEQRDAAGGDMTTMRSPRQRKERYSPKRLTGIVEECSNQEARWPPTRSPAPWAAQRRRDGLNGQVAIA